MQHGTWGFHWLVALLSRTYFNKIVSGECYLRLKLCQKLDYLLATFLNFQMFFISFYVAWCKYSNGFLFNRTVIDQNIIAIIIFEHRHPNPAGIYLFRGNNRNTRTRCEICLNLTIKTPEWRHWRLSGVFIVKFELVLHLLLVFFLLSPF